MAAPTPKSITHSIAGPTGELLIAERLRWLDAANEPLRIIIGTDKRLLDHELNKFNKVLLWALGAFALSMISAAVLLLLYAMAPFAHLRAALAKVRGNAAPNLSGKFPDEVQPLIDDLNNLLSTSGEQILRARAQAGNIAHGLKTPLAILVDEAHQLAQKGDQQSAAVVHEQCRRMQSQIDYQIARARTAATRSKHGGIAQRHGGLCRTRAVAIACGPRPAHRERNPGWRDGRLRGPGSERDTGQSHRQCLQARQDESRPAHR